VDQATGVREEAAFVGPVGAQILVMLHLPAGALQGGVLLCPSIVADFNRNYRREVVIARTLAARGIAAARFHYRGTGNSDGDSADMTLDSMVADAELALGRLAAATGGKPLALAGTRFGTLIAATAARALDGAPVALFEPTIEATRFFREGFRAKRAADVVDGSSPAGGAVDEIHARGSVDVLGHGVDRALYDSTDGLTLQTALGDRPRPIQWLQLGGQDLRGEARRVADALTAGGFVVDTDVVGPEMDWWFLDRAEIPADDVAAAVTGWLAARLAGAAA
jgi:alpha/beta superfamily hydrolase